LFCLIMTSLSTTNNAQIVSLGCVTQDDAFRGLDRNNWNGGNTTFHSEGSMHNFNLPANTFGDCKKISNIEVEITINDVDESNMAPGCAVFDYFFNVYNGCSTLDPVSCNTLLTQIQGFPVSQTANYTCPPHSFDFGGVFGFDLVPAMADVSCPNGQNMLTSGSIILDYEFCVTVTIID